MNLTEEELRSLSREYLNSYYSLNTYIGCTIDCAYCFLAPIGIVPSVPIRVISEEDLVAEALADPLFVRGETVISLNNRTDPFLNHQVKNSTFRLMDILERENLTNPVTITSKGMLTIEDVRRLDEYRHILPIIIVTYNGMPRLLQPIDCTLQEATMRHVATCQNVRLIHQFRPIIPGLNDSEETIRRTCSYASRFCDATIYQGVRVNKFICERLQARNYEYTGTLSTKKIKSHKVDAVFQAWQQENPTYHIFDHTSCCLSYVLRQPDYNVCYREVRCSVSCPNYVRCHDEAPVPPVDLAEQLARIGIYGGWAYTEGRLRVSKPITDEQRSFVRHILHLPCDYEHRRSLFSEKMMERGDV
ncbi:hypothetical protein [Selenomonas sp.]|uniref:hypothetical protein n=1 Tax=Selenomonas sp. TaxID=2053611 RepID=UPI003FA1E7CD